MKKDYAEYLLNKTKEDYNLIGEDFSRTRQNIWEEIRFLFNVKDNERVLDLGCGNGRYYELLKDSRYIGVDNSEKLIDIARKRFPRADFRVSEAFNLEFQDNYFDKIYSIAVLHHIPSKELRTRFLEEAKRVLKEKGIIVITVWKFHKYSLLLKYTLLKIIGKSKLDFKDIFESWSDVTERYYHWFSKRELVKLMKDSGFEVKESGITRNERGNRKNIYVIAMRP